MEWFSGLGLAAGLFFLIKGLLWLCVPAAVVLVRKRQQARRPAHPQTGSPNDHTPHTQGKR